RYRGSVARMEDCGGGASRRASNHTTGLQIAGQAKESIPPGSKQPTIGLEFTPSSFHTLTDPAAHPPRPTDSRRSILHFHASSLPSTHSSGYLSDLHIPCSEFVVSVLSIDRSIGVSNNW